MASDAADPHATGRRRTTLLALLFASLTPLWSPAAAQAALAAQGTGTDSPSSVPLQCRLHQGPWQQCRMDIQVLGLQWDLVIGDQRLEFRHDGRGTVTMQRPGGPKQSVSSRWAEDTSLCWDGVCAKGAIPLD